MTLVQFNLTSSFLIILLSSAWTLAAPQENDQSDLENTYNMKSIVPRAETGIFHLSVEGQETECRESISASYTSQTCELVVNTLSALTNLLVTMTFNTVGSGTVGAGGTFFTVNMAHLKADVTVQPGRPGSPLVFRTTYTPPLGTSTLDFNYGLTVNSNWMPQLYTGKITINLNVVKSAALEINSNS